MHSLKLYRQLSIPGLDCTIGRRIKHAPENQIFVVPANSKGPIFQLVSHVVIQLDQGCIELFIVSGRRHVRRNFPDESDFLVLFENRIPHISEGMP
ncbi:hypothetical protein B0E51_17345 [Rhodanobacter sp. C05]|nr:hypothetical protein B0E51_17345 [Rhodanobacter sp. C05]